jgi:hypothetical protein
MLGISKNEARYLGSEKRGRPTLVLVRAGSRLDEAARILREQAADDVEHVREAPTSVAMGATP